MQSRHIGHMIGGWMCVCVCVCALNNQYAGAHSSSWPCRGLILVLAICCGISAAGTVNWNAGGLLGTAQQQSHGCLLHPSCLCSPIVNSKQQMLILVNSSQQLDWRPFQSLLKI